MFFVSVFMRPIFPALIQADFYSALFIPVVPVPQTKMQPGKAKVQPASGIILQPLLVLRFHGYFLLVDGCYSHFTLLNPMCAPSYMERESIEAFPPKQEKGESKSETKTIWAREELQTFIRCSISTMYEIFVDIYLYVSFTSVRSS